MSNVKPKRTGKEVGQMGKARRPRGKNKVSAKQSFNPELTLEVISEDFDSEEPKSCIVDEAPEPGGLKDFGEVDRRIHRETDSGTSGRDGFVRYLSSLADESLLTHDEEAELGREMALGRQVVREAVLENGIELIPFNNAINRVRAGEMTVREIVDLDSFECGDELADRNLAVLDLLKKFNLEAERYVHLINDYVDSSLDDASPQSIDRVRARVAKLVSRIPLQDSFITQMADAVVSFLDSVRSEGDGEDVKLESVASKCERSSQEEAAAERESLETFGLPYRKIRPVAERIRNGLEIWRNAQSQLVRSNLRLVISIAKHYINAGVPIEDMVQEGNMGLMRATEKYEYHRGTRFSTYAAFWIRHAIIKSIERQARTIRLPGHIFDFSNRISTTAVAFQQKLGRAPTESEIADVLGVSQEKVEEIAGYSHYSIVPLFTDTDSENELNLIDVLPNPSCNKPERYIEEREIADGLDRALDVLTEKERLVVELRNGLKDGHPHSLRQVGEAMNLTRERIRQIEKVALEKVRVSGLADTLMAYT